jgi:PAS domain S-box-containing protein
MLQQDIQGESPARAGAAAMIGDVARYVAEIALIGTAYFLLAKGGLQLASVNPSATPVWPPTGLALAVILLRGYRVWPAIVAGAFLANATTAGSPAIAAAIAAGNGLEALAGGMLINLWARGRDAFMTPGNVARFTLIATAASAVSATIGVGVLNHGGYADWPRFAEIWTTWWLGDLTGALLVTPVIVLWASRDDRWRGRGAGWEGAAIFATAVAIGLVAFSPLIGQAGQRDALSFVAVLPLLWAALRRNQRETATVALALAGFAVWGTMVNGGPFARAATNDSFLMLLMFLISISVPSLALSADVAARRRVEERLRRTQAELENTIKEEIARRRQLEAEFTRGSDVHKRTEEALVDSARHFQILIQGVTDYAIYMLDPEGRISSWNSGAERIKGYASEDIVGQHFSRFYTEEDRARGEPARALATAARTGKYEKEGWRVRRDGSRFWASVVIDAIRDDRGALIGFAKITRDITEKRQAQAALDKTREELAQSQKMEAVGQLTGGIAHDFNNLLMVVGGHVQILQRRLTDPKITQAIEAIDGAAKRGAALTRQLLAFSRRQPLASTVIDLGECIAAMRPMLESSLRGDIDVKYDVADNVWPVEVDVAELELALLNIAVNSRDAMPNGGVFTVSARNVEVGDPSLPTSLPVDSVALAFSDTGTGIAPEILTKVFEPFFTTKAIGEGTGLGLSQVYGFAQNVGGAAAVTSTVDQGTTVTMYFPRSKGEPLTVENAAAQTIAGGEETILVVEDSAEVAEVTASLLDQLGYQVVRVENAADALKTLADGAPIDLVFSDIVMPGAMSGIDLGRRIRAQYPRLPVLLTSGYSNAPHGVESEFVILRKPFEVVALAKAIRDMFGN